MRSIEEIKNDGKNLFNQLGLKPIETKVNKLEEYLRDNWIDILIICTIIVFIVYTGKIQGFIQIKGMIVNANNNEAYKLFITT